MPLSGLAFLVSFTAPIKQLPNVKPVFKRPYMWFVWKNKFTISLWRKHALFCCKQIPLKKEQSNSEKKK